MLHASFRTAGILFLLVVLFSSPTFAQPTSSVSGYVTDASSGETLLLANVVVEGTPTGAATNNAGYYIISGLKPGRYTFVISYVGYKSLRKEVTLAPGENRRLDVALQPDSTALDELVVSTEREEDEQRSQIGITRLPTRLVTELPTVFEADVFRSLQRLPGIKAANDFSSGLYIRGGTPDQTLILLDRTTVYNPSHFYGLFSTFNPDALKDVQVYKGGYPAEYGGRLGSVIDIYNKDGNREEVEGTLSLGLLASRVSIEGPFSKGSWMLAVRRSTLEPLLAVLRQTEDGIPETFYFYDVNGKINYDAGPNDRLSLAVYGGTDNLYVEPSDDLSIDLPYGNRTGSLTWNHLFSGQVFSSLTLTGSRYFSLPIFSFGGTEYARRNRVYDFSLKNDVEYQPTTQHALEAGLWAGALTLKLRDSFDGQEGFTSRIQTLYGSAYVQETWEPSERWTIRGGLRLNAFGEGCYTRLAPRLSIEHQLHPQVRLQAAYGRYYQFLTLITNEAFSGLDVWLTADQGVPPAWGDQYVLGLKTRPAEGLRFDAELYYRTMEDLFELDPNLQDAAGLDYAQLFRVGDGYAYGAEVLLEKTRGSVTGFLGYDYGHTRRRFPSTNAGNFYPPKYDRTHDLSLVLNVDLSSHWRATATFNYATGQAYTQALGRTRYGDPFSSGETNNIIVGRVNASRLPAYHRLDLGVTRKGRFLSVADYELQLQIINLYNRRNPWFYEYDFDQNPVERDTVRMLPILPNISFSLSF